jgi:multiple sugar transport system permease protein
VEVVVTRHDRNARRIVLHVCLLAGLAVVLLPFADMVLIGLRPANEAFGPLSEWRPSIENVVTVFHEVPMLRYYVNSIVVAGTLVVVQLLIGLPAAYYIARLSGRGGKAWENLILVAIAVPGMAVAVPIYLGLSELGLLNTRLALILPFVTSPFAIFLLTQYLRTVPASVFDSARVDGAGSWRTVWSVALPICRPAVVAHAAFSFVSTWNALFWPALVLRDHHAATVPFGIAQFTNDITGDRYGPQMAAALLAVVPLLVGYLLAHRQVQEGIALSGETG